MTISLCMIVRNEEDVLARCLDSVRDAVDEIVIVDTGSTDGTKEVARRYTEKVYDFPWQDDFAQARNFSFSKAGMEYCMWLDADDVLLDPDREALLRLKAQLPPEVDVVMMRYHVAFDAGGRPTFSYYRERLVRNSPDYRWRGAVHEAIAPNGCVKYEECAVCHWKTRPSDPDRNLRIYQKLLAEGARLEPRDQFYYARELYYHGEDWEAVRVLEAFLDEGRGWVENSIEACRVLAYCLYRVGEDRAALRALLRTFEFDAPRAEVCCELGKHFLDRDDCRRAVFWYELALARPRDDRTGGFVSPDCYGYLPALQLCVAYDRLGDRDRAQAYNEYAASFRPESAAVGRNREYFLESAQPPGAGAQ